MCGRYASFRQAQAIADAFDVVEVSADAGAVRPSFNVAPAQPVRVLLERVLDDDPAARPRLQREMHAARWGLVPAGAPGTPAGARMFKARSETAGQRSAFAGALSRRRCVVPADGYYEWRTVSATGKVPYFVHHDDATPIALAGLFSVSPAPAADDDEPERWVLSTTILTRTARPELAFLHDREPVLLAPETVDDWLDPTQTSTEAALALLGVAPPRVHLHRVDAKVADVRRDSPALIEPVGR